MNFAINNYIKFYIVWELMVSWHGFPFNRFMKLFTLTPNMELSTDELVYLIKQNDRKAFDYLYLCYSNNIFRAILVIVKDEHIAQDALQETFLKIWNNIDSYAASKGGLYCWMRSIAANVAIDSLRTKTSIMRSKSNIEITEEHAATFTNAPDAKLDGIGLKKVISRLKEDQQTLINLVYYQGYTFEQIAKILGKPLGTVKTQVRTTLKVLRSEFNVAAA